MVTERKALYTTTLPSIFPILRSHNSQQMLQMLQMLVLVLCALVLHRYTNTQFPAVRALFGKGISGEGVAAMMGDYRGHTLFQWVCCKYGLQQVEEYVKGNVGEAGTGERI